MMADENLLRVEELKRRIRNLSPLQRLESADVRDSLGALSRLLARGPRGGYTTSEVGQRARRIELSRLEEYVSELKKRSDELFSADIHPFVASGRQTPEQNIAMQKRLDKLRMTPEQIAHRRNVEEFGEVGAAEVEAAERVEIARSRSKQAESLMRRRRLDRERKDQASREAFSRAMLSNEERRRADLTERFGGGSIGRFRADSVLDKERRERLTEIARKRHADRLSRQASSREAFRYDMMDEFDQKMEDLTKRYGGDTGKADTAMRNLLKKELPPFFKNSRMSTKDLHKTAEMFRSARKIPFVGHAIGMTANPFAAAVGAALTGIMTSAENSKKIVDWSLSAAVTGTPSKEFGLAMKKAGVGDEGAVLKKYGAMTSWLAALDVDPSAWDVLGDVALASKGKVSLAGITSRSTPEDIAMRVAPQMRNLSFNERLRTVQALGKMGVDEKVINAFETYAGTKETTKDQDVVGGVQHRIDTARKMFAEHPFLNMDQLVYITPYLGKLVATLDEMTLRLFGSGWSGESVKNPSMGIAEAMSAASDIAQSGLTFDTSSSAGGGTTVNRGDTNVSFSFGDIITPNPDEFGQQIKTLGSQYLGDMSMWQDVLEKEDGKVR